MTGLRVVEWGFRNKRLEGYFARDFEMAVLVVQEDLRPEARRAREMEAEGYYERPSAFKRRQKACCYTAANVLEVEPGRGAGAEVQDRTRAAGLGGAGQGRVGIVPGRGVGGVLGGGADTAVVAILLNLDERGELKIDD